MDDVISNFLGGLMASLVCFALPETVGPKKWRLLRKYVNRKTEHEAPRAENSISRDTPLIMPEREGTMPYSDPNILRDLEQGRIVGMDSDLSTSDSGNRSEAHEDPAMGRIAGLVDEEVGFNEA